MADSNFTPRGESGDRDEESALLNVIRAIEKHEAEKQMRGPNSDWERYDLCDWGDLIHGTKEQLQALGLGVGRSFPGEAGCPSRELQLRDPRGFPAVVSQDREGRFVACISFPHVPKRPAVSRDVGEVAPGVRLRQSPCADVYSGTDDSLVAAGLANPDQFPGMPGRRKAVVTIYADGTIASGAPTRRDARADEPGCRQIERIGRGKRFRVIVRIDESEALARRAIYRAAEGAWLREVRRMARPERLSPARRDDLKARQDAVQQAAQDGPFQAVLARIAAGTAR